VVPLIPSDGGGINPHRLFGWISLTLDAIDGNGFTMKHTASKTRAYTRLTDLGTSPQSFHGHLVTCFGNSSISKSCAQNGSGCDPLSISTLKRLPGEGR